jgi:ATP phosphoribosyltransferase
MNNIDDYINLIIKDKGLDSESPEVLAQIKSDLSESIENRINAMIITNIPEDKLEDFEKALDSNDQEKIQAYIKKEIPDIDQKVALELAHFRAFYLG